MKPVFASPSDLPCRFRRLRWMLALTGVVLIGLSPGSAQTVLPPGTLDTSFDSDGLRSRNINTRVFDGLDLILTADDRPIIVTGAQLAPGSMSTDGRDAAVLQFTTGGADDASFSGDGLALFDRIAGLDPFEGFRAAALQPDGKLVLTALVLTSPSTFAISVVRLLPDGSLDPSFSGDGLATLALEPTVAGTTGRALAVQADGRIVLAGNRGAGPGGTLGYFIARFNADGTLDDAGVLDSTPGEGFSVGDGFGIDGVYEASGADGNNINTGQGRLPMRLQGDRIVLLSSNASNRMNFYAHAPDGARDASFGTNGVTVVTGPTPTSCGQSDFVVQPADQKLLFTSTCAQLGRLNADGSVDTAFGGGGDGLVAARNGSRRQLTPDLQAGQFAPRRIALQADGRIVLAGPTNAGVVHLARFYADGLPDTSFGDDRIETPGQYRSQTALAIDSSGRVLFADQINNPGSSFTIPQVGVLIGGPGVDTQADPFSFTDQFAVPASSVRTSAPITVEGLAVGVPAIVRVTGGTYSIGCTAIYTSNMDKVVNGQTLCLRHTAAAGAGISVDTTLLLSAGADEVSDVFTSTTFVNSPGSLQFLGNAAVSETAGTVNLTVTRSGGSVGAVSATVTTAAGTATAGEDFVATMQTVSFADGDAAPKTVSIGIVDDALVEADESFSLALSGLAGGASLGTPSVATVSIVSDDVDQPGSLQFEVASASVNEDGGSVTFNVTRSGGTDGAVAATVTAVNGSALEGEDYQFGAPLTVNFADGDAAPRSFAVTILDDTRNEAAESFALALSAPSGGATLGSPAGLAVTILDNDAPQRGTLTLVLVGFSNSVNENAGAFTLGVTRSGGTDGVVSATISTENGTAAAGVDYVPTTQVVSFADGSSAMQTVSIPIIDNDEPGPIRNFVVRISAPSGGAALGSPQSRTVFINEDEDPNEGTVHFSSATYSVVEGAVFANISVTRDLAFPGYNSPALSVRYQTRNGSAVAGPDYEGAFGVLSWAGGETGPKTFQVRVLQDAIHDPQETVNLELFGLTVGTLGSPATAVLTINDAVLPDVRFGGTNRNVVEHVGLVPLVVTLSRPSTLDVSVPYTVDLAGGTANALDYEGLADGILVIPAGTTSASIDFTVIDDAIDESPIEYVTVDLGTPVNAIRRSPFRRIVGIVDDEPTPSVQFAAAAQQVSEGFSGSARTPFRVEVRLSGPSAQAISTPIGHGGDATRFGSDRDVVSINGSTFAEGEAVPRVEFPPGSTVAYIDVVLGTDSLDEIDRTLSLSLGPPDPGGASGAFLGSPTLHLLTIVDDDPVPTLRFAGVNQRVGERVGTVTVEAVLSAASSLDVSASIGFGGTLHPSELDRGAAALTIPAGSTRAFFTFSVFDDALDEAQESVVLTLETPVNARRASPLVRTVLIDDDDPLPLLFMGGVDQRVAEGVGSVTVEAVLGAVSGRDVTGSFTVGGSADSLDRSGLDTRTFTIPAGSTRVPISFQIQDDARDEAQESVVITLDAATHARLRSPLARTVLIDDNDPPEVRLVSGFASGTEGQSVPVSVAVQLSSASGKAITLNLSTQPQAAGSGLADFPGDVDFETTPIIIPAGLTSFAFRLIIQDDELPELAETFRLRLNPTADVSVDSSADRFLLTIADDDN